MDSEIPPRERVKGKRMVLDIRIQIERKEKDEMKDEMVDVEMQTTTQRNFTDRILAYASRMYSERIDVGEHYENLRRVYSLVFATTSLPEFAIKELEKRILSRLFHSEGQVPSCCFDKRDAVCHRGTIQIPQEFG